MKKISDIAKDIQNKNEQREINLEETLMNQIKARETNFLNSLQESESLMKTALAEKNKEMQEKINSSYQETEQHLKRWMAIRAKAEKGKNLILILVTTLIMVLFTLLAVNYWLGKSIQTLSKEKAELQLTIAETPLERKILARIEYQEDKEAIYIATKKNLEVTSYQNSSGQEILKIQK